MRKTHDLRNSCCRSLADSSRVSRPVGYVHFKETMMDSNVGNLSLGLTLRYIKYAAVFGLNDSRTSVKIECLENIQEVLNASKEIMNGDDDENH